MAKTKEQKEKEIKILGDNIEKQETLVLLDYSGVKSAAVFALRDKLKKENCKLRVVKKTLLEKALEKLGKKELAERIAEIKTQLALVFGFNKDIAPIKLCWEAGRENQNLKILGGLFDNEFIDQKRMIELAQLPSRQELLAKAVGSLMAPLTNFNSILKANIKGLVWVIKAIKDKK